MGICGMDLGICIFQKCIRLVLYTHKYKNMSYSHSLRTWEDRKGHYWPSSQGFAHLWGNKDEHSFPLPTLGLLPPSVTKEQVHRWIRWKHFTVSSHSCLGIQVCSEFLYLKPALPAAHRMELTAFLTSSWEKKLTIPKDISWLFGGKIFFSFGLSFMCKTFESVAKHFRNRMCTNKILIKIQIFGFFWKIRKSALLSAFLYRGGQK